MKSRLSLGASRFWASYTVIFMSERYLYSHFIRVRGNLSTNRSRYINYQSDLFCELILGLKILGVENTVSDFGAVHLAFQTYTNLLINLNQTTEKTPTFGFIYTYPRLSKFHYQFELLASSSWSRLNRGPTDLLLPSSTRQRHFWRWWFGDGIGNEREDGEVEEVTEFLAPLWSTPQSISLGLT